MKNKMKEKRERNVKKKGKKEKGWKGNNEDQKKEESKKEFLLFNPFFIARQGQDPED